MAAKKGKKKNTWQQITWRCLKAVITIGISEILKRKQDKNTEEE